MQMGPVGQLVGQEPPSVQLPEQYRNHSPCRREGVDKGSGKRQKLSLSKPDGAGVVGLNDGLRLELQFNQFG